MTPEQLKASILQQAMEGKLVKQDPNDEPANVLVKQITDEKARLIKEKNIRRTKKLPAITDDEKPFDIPDSWEWVRLGTIFDVKGGKRVPRGKRLNTSHQGKPYLRVADMVNGSIKKDDLHYADDSIVEQISKYTISSKDLYFSIAGTIGKVGQIPNELNNAQLTENAAKLVAYDYVNVCDEYFVITLESNLVRNQHKTMLNQMAQPKLALFRLKNTLIPLPPLSEQKRIVAKIEKLMPLVDEYAESYNQLTKIDANFNDQMKQSILQYAMEGKLVKQDPHDEPASELLKQIETEKAQLVKEKKIRKRKPLPEITDDEKPFDIPDSWEWVRLGDIGDYIQRGRSPEYDKSSKNHPIISQKCVQWMGISLNDAKYITDAFFNKLEDHRFIQQNDILWNSTGTGTVGRLNIVKRHFDHVPVDSHVTLVRMNKHINSDYIYYYLCSPLIQDNLNDYLTGTTKQKELGLGNILKVKIPVPPLEEQKRIIAKIEKVFATL